MGASLRVTGCSGSVWAPDAAISQHASSAIDAVLQLGQLQIKRIAREPKTERIKGPHVIRVLLVEDVRQTSELICELLDALGGFQVVGTCMTEHGALCWLEDNPVQPDIVVLDLVLREGSGFSLLGRLAGYGCDAVVFSDFASPAVADKCRRMGALDAITKADLRRFRTFLRDYAVGRRRARVPARRQRAADGAS